MNEEEIIKGITNIINTCNDVIEDEEWYNQEEIESAKKQLKFTEGLLDLYNKEREKNKELLKEREDYAEEYIHNNPWLYKQLNELYIFRAEVDRNYISKDRIKEEMKWLQENILDNDYASDEDKEQAEYQVIILERLLEIGGI